MSDKIDALEKKVFAAAILLSAIHLGLIAYAAIHWGITVPSCVAGVKPFETGSLKKIAEGRYEIHILTKMWGFEPSKIRLPAGSIADIFVASKDVTHGFHIGGTTVNLTAVPGAVNNAQIRFSRPGVYPIVCNEYCGAGHQAMSASFEITDPAESAAAEGLAPPSDSAASGSAAAAPSTGRKLLESKGCIACHSFDGKAGVGPTFKGLWGRKEEMLDGTFRVVDESYVRESILDPPKNTVKGFGPVMPKLPLTEEEITQIIGYMKTLE